MLLSLFVEHFLSFLDHEYHFRRPVAGLQIDAGSLHPDQLTQSPSAMPTSAANLSLTAESLPAALENCTRETALAW